MIIVTLRDHKGEKLTARELAILIPAEERSDVDWLSANRIVKENKDFKQYVEQVDIYHQTGKLISTIWNR